MVIGISGAFLAIATAIIIFISFGADFNAVSYTSKQQIIPPILTTFFITSFVAIFIPWIIAWIIERRKYPQTFTSNKYIQIFSQATISSILFLSFPIFGYILYITTAYGPWPGTFLPPLPDSYAYMVIGILGTTIYLVVIIILMVMEGKMIKKERNVLIS